MPIKEFYCKKCKITFELMFLPVEQKPAVACPKCGNQHPEPRMSSPIIRMNKADLETVPDPEPPLQRQKRKGPREGYEGGYEDIPEVQLKDMKSTRDEYGNRTWREKERTIFSG